MRQLLLAVALLTGCDSREAVSVASQEVGGQCGSVAEMTAVYEIGDDGAPTEDELANIQTSPPAGTEPPTLADIAAVAQGAANSAPEEFCEISARPRGTIGCVTDWGKVTCWVTTGGRTYYCQGTVAWISCGSFSGGWL